MENEISLYISRQPGDRHQVLNDIHQIIIGNDQTITPVIEPMMGKEMIIYKAKGMMKYALSGVKNYMSLHVLPMYGSPVLYAKYKALMPAANFQKGCINFITADEVPLKILKQLVSDCSKIDLVKMREGQLAQRKEEKKKKSKK